MSYKNYKSLFGLGCELFVIISYLFCGYKVLKHRWRKKNLEIDIIFVKGKEIVFCEVKGRSSNFNKEFLVSSAQKKRLIYAAKLFISFYPQYSVFNVRFDLAAIYLFKLPLFYKNWIN